MEAAVYGVEKLRLPERRDIFPNLSRKSLTVIPLPHTVTQGHPPASENHSQSSPCLTRSLRVIPLLQKILFHTEARLGTTA